MSKLPFKVKSRSIFIIYKISLKNIHQCYWCALFHIIRESELQQWLYWVLIMGGCVCIVCLGLLIVSNPNCLQELITNVDTRDKGYWGWISPARSGDYQWVSDDQWDHALIWMIGVKTLMMTVEDYNSSWYQIVRMIQTVHYSLCHRTYSGPTIGKHQDFFNQVQDAIQLN